MKQVIITSDIERELETAVAEIGADRVFVLTDENTRRVCWPKVEKFECLQNARMITIPADDVNKTLDSCGLVWKALQEGGATRHSLLVNLGGGMVTDLGGFAASCFKRGIRFLNIPTTLLAMVDASVGGKTGVNFGGLKNEIGVFSNPCSVLLSTIFLDTLDDQNILSGYAEMLKHSLISTPEMWAALLTFDLCQLDYERLSLLLADSVAVKERIVGEDPKEHGVRKVLNVGHTIGHALESFCMEHEKPVLHGIAVAWGIVAELYLSAVKKSFPTARLRQTVAFIRENYPPLSLTCNDYPEIIRLMRHDKKNIGSLIRCSLLSDIGAFALDESLAEEEIKEALDFLREG